MTIPSVTRSLIKHRIEPTTYAVEMDFEGVILGALDVTSEVTSGGFCSHTLSGLPLAGSIDTVEQLNRQRDDFEAFQPTCGNVHHLFNDILTMKKSHRAALAAFALADARAKALEREAKAQAAKIEELLGRLVDQKPLPLFDGYAQ